MNTQQGARGVTTWIFVTGEYPPQAGGVSDYTWAIAHALHELGDEVHVFAPGPVAGEFAGNVKLHRLGSRFGPQAVLELHRRLTAFPAPRRVVLQFVPQSFGLRGVNIPFMLSLCRLRRYPLWVMFHEFAITDDSRLSALRRLQAWGTRLAAAIAARNADKILVSTAAWVPLVSAVAPHRAVVELPVPSNIPTEGDAAAVAAIRARYGFDGTAAIVGHFGTYRMAATKEFLETALVDLCLSATARQFLLLGRDSDAFAADLIAREPALAGRLHGFGALEPQDLANHLSACDVVLQPYEDGVTTRRSSLIAALALGIAAVTTTGESTEAFWAGSGAVLLAPFSQVSQAVLDVESLLNDPERRRVLERSARELYRERFSVARTVSAMREA